MHNGTLFPTSSPTLTTSSFYEHSHSNRSEVISYGGFERHIPEIYLCWTLFQVHVGNLYVFFGKKCLFRFWVMIIFCLWIVWVPYISWILMPIGYRLVDIFSLSIGCLFILLMGSSDKQKLLSLVHLVYFCFYCFCFSCKKKKSLSRPLWRHLLSLFSSRSFMVSGLCSNL